MRKPRIDIVASSGTLRVAIHPKPHWLLVLLDVGVFSVFAIVLYRNWVATPMSLRVFLGFVLVSIPLDLAFRFSGTELIEFGPREMTVCKEIRGWERKKTYKLEDCSELEWAESSESDHSGLKCKVGWSTITVSKYLTEDDVIKILTALQTNLPDVAQKLCSYPNTKQNFITLGLTQQK
jgi:hypothetical protein